MNIYVKRFGGRDFLCIDGENFIPVDEITRISLNLNPPSKDFDYVTVHVSGEQYFVRPTLANEFRKFMEKTA